MCNIADRLAAGGGGGGGGRGVGGKLYKNKKKN